MAHKHEKKEEIIRELASKFLIENATNNSLLTITRALLSDDEAKATIFFTVLPVEKEEAALNFAKRNRSDFKEYLKKGSRLARIPFIDFAIDIGEKNRQRIYELGQQE